MRKLYLPPKWLKILGIAAAVGVLGLLFLLVPGRGAVPSETVSESRDEPLLLAVHVSGAVAEPDVLYYLPEGSRVADALETAGGALPEADLSRLNLAALLRDGQKIQVPLREEAGESGPLNLNLATAEELERLPGIGAALAGRIVSYREKYGPFAEVEDLLNVSGIGEKLLAAIEDQICV